MPVSKERIDAAVVSVDTEDLDILGQRIPVGKRRVFTQIGSGVQQRSVGVAGTFNAAAILGLQAGGVQDRVTNATERTAKGVDALRQDVRNSVIGFR